MSFSHAFHDHTYVIKTMAMHKCLQFSATEAPSTLELDFEISNLQSSGVWYMESISSSFKLNS